MRAEVTKIGKSSRQVPIIRQRIDAILPEYVVERLHPLVPEGPAEEGTVLEERRAVEFWSSSREAVRR